MADEKVALRRIKELKDKGDQQIKRLNSKLAKLTHRKEGTSRAVGGSVIAITSGAATAALKAVAMKKLPPWARKIPIDAIAAAAGLAIAFFGDELGLSDDSVEVVASVAEGPAIVFVADTIREAINPTAMTAVSGVAGHIDIPDIMTGAAEDEVEHGR